MIQLFWHELNHQVVTTNHGQGHLCTSLGQCFHQDQENGDFIIGVLKWDIFN